MAIDRDEEAIVMRLAIKYSLPADAVRTVLAALRSGGGSMAQFSHPAFGGMAQWSPGMAMVGDMFNTALKAKLDALCADLALFLKEHPQPAGSEQSAPVSYRSTSQSSAAWWPASFGEPTSVGSQNALRYAAFPRIRRLAIDDNGKITIYDTGEHQISGVSQSQSSSQTLTFTSQKGLVRVADLPVVSLA
ncbi:hypothetical protein [Beijerinckia indica]|uniref:SHOCT domain-containing protein n=1 Tax=Beijerinckia indica subsp. indica (strain ATCC 9039 / DSM 1715 / NCIMB 8712) TaxID=395963 RepID=B2IK39_BEII9|nr:hypothetical protein [Beijerinckia indica]ACB94971.1 conserved hypothetical protein [Beijerinckia indica subsp. indica ATCC 9039]